MKMYIVDAFAEKVFQGNSAAVCITDSWMNEDKMQAIAAENNLSETAFIVKEGEVYHKMVYAIILNRSLWTCNSCKCFYNR